MKGRIIGIGGLLIILVLLISMLGCSQEKKPTTRKITTSEKPDPNAEKMPDIQLTTLDDKPFSRKDLKKQKTVFFFFNSLCKHCQKNAKHLVEHADKLKDVQVVLFSSEPLKALKQFEEVYSMNKYDNYQVMHINDKDIYKFFGSIQVPSTFIYNRHHEVVNKIIGNTYFEFIIDNIPS